MEKWYLHTKKADFADLSRRFHISPMLARILRNREINTDAQISRFLQPDISGTYDPFLLKGMDAGIDLAQEMVCSHRKIRIVGDYDTDGICSSFILSSFFESIGGIVDVRLPDRVADGYGLNEEMVREAAHDGISLIITCDNGISSMDSVAIAKNLGIHVVITDHHEPGTVLPDADAVIDAKQDGCPYPFKEICGACVAYKYVEAYNIKYCCKQEALLDELIQYVGLATIADIVPLVDENRIFAAEGIKRLKSTDNLGLNILMQERRLEKDKINAGTVGFVIAPCLNSAGRLKNAMLSYDLLKTASEEEAWLKAQELSGLNEERKKLTTEQTEIALEQLKITEEAQGLPRVLTVFLPDAHESLAGIIAGRIKDEYNRPAIVVTRSGSGLKGSGRSVEGYNMIAALQRSPELFQKYGGHPMACGFTLQMMENEEETLQYFSERINRECGLSDDDLVKRVWIDMELPFKYVSPELVMELSQLEPYGLGNEKPVFAGRQIQVHGASILGVNRNVLKLSLEDSYGCTMDGIMFGNEKMIAASYREIVDAKMLNLLFYPDINEFRGRRTPQVIIKSYLPVRT